MCVCKYVYFVCVCVCYACLVPWHFPRSWPLSQWRRRGKVTLCRLYALYSTHPPCCSIVSAVLFNACNYQGYLTVTFFFFTRQLRECNRASCGKLFQLRLLAYKSNGKHVFWSRCNEHISYKSSYYILNVYLKPQMKCKIKISCFAVNVYKLCNLMVAFHFCSLFMISLGLWDVITSLIVVVCSPVILPPLSPGLCACVSVFICCIRVLYVCIHTARSNMAIKAENKASVLSAPQQDKHLPQART